MKRISRRLATVALLLHAAAYQTLAAPPDTSFTFQGQVKQSGSPMNGNVPMSFKLYDSAVGGGQVGSTLTFDGLGGNPAMIPVSGGLFTTKLDFGVSAYAPNQAAWLEITANGQTLSPRQAMTGAPYSLNTRGIYVDGESRVTVGASLPSTNFAIFGDSYQAGASTIQADFGEPGVPPQMVIKGAGDSGRQLLFGFNTSQNFGYIEGIWQGVQFRPVVINPAYGVVGVGTENPNCTFHVEGKDTIPTSRFSSGPDSIYGAWFSLDSTGQAGGQDWWLGSTANAAGEGQGKLIVKNSSGNLYAMAITSNGNVGIGTLNPGAFKLAVNGTAANSTGSWSVFSDARLKQNITALTPGVLDRVLSLHGVEFEYTPEAVKARNVAPGRTVGFIAQDVEKVFPQWVSTDDQGYRYVTERGTTALMVEALRDLRAEKDAEIAALNARITRLEAALNK